MTIPDWYQLLLLGAAAWRTFNLLGYDTIFDTPRNWLLGLPWRWKVGDEIPEKYKRHWALFITCPYCAGFWISVAWFVAFQISEFWTIWAAVAFVINTLVVAQAKVLTPED